VAELTDDPDQARAGEDGEGNDAPVELLVRLVPSGAVSALDPAG
jgi:hypothetical protein